MSFSTGTRAAVMEGLAWLSAALAVAYFVSQIDIGKVRQLAHQSGDAAAAGSTSSNKKSAAAGESSGKAMNSGLGVELRLGRDGHYHADAEVNGRSVSVLVDTGASLVALTYEDAEAAGIYVKPSDFTHQSSTANGIARFAPVMIDRISIGSITVRNVQAAVSERGKLSVTLLGMAFLNKLSSVQMREGKLVLQD